MRLREKSFTLMILGLLCSLTIPPPVTPLLAAVLSAGSGSGDDRRADVAVVGGRELPSACVAG